MNHIKKRGFTLIEVIIAVAILAIIVVPIGRALYKSGINTSKSAEKLEATQISQSQMEAIKSEIAKGTPLETNAGFASLNLTTSGCAITSIAGPTATTGGITWDAVANEKYKVQYEVTSSNTSGGAFASNAGNEANSSASPDVVSSAAPLKLTITNTGGVGKVDGSKRGSTDALTYYVRVNSVPAIITVDNKCSAVKKINIVAIPSDSGLSAKMDDYSSNVIDVSTMTMDNATLANSSGTSTLAQYTIGIKVTKTISPDFNNPIVQIESKRLIRR